MRSSSEMRRSMSGVFSGSGFSGVFSLGSM